VVIDSVRYDFLRTFFPNHQSERGEVYKLLTVNPGCRLSWQYHNRRHEYWNVISGPVLMYLSNNDEIPTPCHYESGSIITIPVLHRHMAEALTTPVVIAEIWSHCSDLPSTEEDIVRVTDWYHR
jgi:mannose-1-phosphate guanylyltransferase